MIPQLQMESELLGIGPDGLRAVLDNLPVAVILTDEDGTLLMCNREAERIFGPSVPPITLLEWCGRRQMYRPDKKTLYSCAELPLARALRGEEVFRELIFITRRTEGEGVWVRTNCRPLMGADGAICGAVAVYFDVSEFRRTMERMNLLALAVEQTADSIVITDTSGIIEYVNPAFETTTGYSREETLGRTPAILKSGRSTPAFYASMWGKILHGEVFRGTLVNRKKSGEFYDAEQTIAPIRNTEGEMTHFVSVLKDVTALRKQQEQTIQLEIARQIQKRLNASTTCIPGLEVGAVVWPAQETGGDYFDSISAAKDSVMVAVGDVSGHGIYAALGMALTRAYLRSTFDRLDVAGILARINNLLCTDLEDEHYVTLMLVHVDLAARVFTYASAGHVPALLFQSSGAVQMLDSTGIPLGLFAKRSFTQHTVPIERGQTLVMLTDGITEAGEGIDTAWIIDYVRSHLAAPAQQIAEGIRDRALALNADEPQRDDMTAVVMKVAT